MIKLVYCIKKRDDISESRDVAAEHPKVVARLRDTQDAHDRSRRAAVHGFERDPHCFARRYNALRRARIRRVFDSGGI